MTKHNTITKLTLHSRYEFLWKGSVNVTTGSDYWFWFFGNERNQNKYHPLNWTMSFCLKSLNRTTEPLKRFSLRTINYKLQWFLLPFILHVLLVNKNLVLFRTAKRLKKKVSYIKESLWVLKGINESILYQSLPPVQ